jgi:hypothetical protein
MTSATPIMQSGYYQRVSAVQEDDDDLAPYAALFQKPLTSKRCAFSRQDLELMCRDPLHSPRLIRYLINFFKQM